MKYSIFISYAWVDNEPFPGADNRWVSTFVDGLQKHLARELGRRDEAQRLWVDYEQMRGNESVTPKILECLEASSTFVLILSAGYVASDWSPIGNCFSITGCRPFLISKSVLSSSCGRT